MLRGLIILAYFFTSFAGRPALVFAPLRPLLSHSAEGTPPAKAPSAPSLSPPIPLPPLGGDLRRKRGLVEGIDE